jgi:Na+/melibiose symporter-like transporter
MLNRILDFVAVISPTAIALIGVLVGMKLAKNPQDQSHKGWWWTIVVLGFICSAGTLWQQDRLQKEHVEEINSQKQTASRLQSTVDNMNGQMTASGVTQIRPCRVS